MARKTVTVCHCLKIIPIENLIRFAPVGSRIIMLTEDPGLRMPETVPGSVLMTTEESEGIYSRTIDFEITEVSAEVSDLLFLLSNLNLVATYKDESGNDRVCGSPGFPLRLSFHDQDGVTVVSLSGQSYTPDGFLAD